MKKEIKHIDIFSDINYIGYQHINQMYFDYVNDRDGNINFYHRFYMRLPSVKELLLRFKKGKMNGLKFENNKSEFNNVHKIFNWPTSCRVLDIINSAFIKRQIKSPKNKLLTFVPSKSLSNVNDTYESIYYYCVHDSFNQEYSNRHRNYEITLVDKSKIVFCDNINVLKRLASEKDIISLADHSIDVLLDRYLYNDVKFFYVDPPTPDCFFNIEIDQKSKKYDFFYYGSIHKDIDIKIFKRLLNIGYRICIMSSSRLDICSENLTYINPSADFNDIVNNMLKCKSLLLPYKNSDFMKTVSPAKINQCLATGMPVFCSNKGLIDKYDLLDIDIIDDVLVDIHSFKMNYVSVETSRSSLIMEKIHTLISYD